MLPVHFPVISEYCVLCQGVITGCRRRLNPERQHGASTPSHTAHQCKAPRISTVEMREIDALAQGAFPVLATVDVSAGVLRKRGQGIARFLESTDI